MMICCWHCWHCRCCCRTDSGRTAWTGRPGWSGCRTPPAGLGRDGWRWPSSTTPSGAGPRWRPIQNRHRRTCCLLLLTLPGRAWICWICGTSTPNQDVSSVALMGSVQQNRTLGGSIIRIALLVDGCAVGRATPSCREKRGFCGPWAVRANDENYPNRTRELTTTTNPNERIL